MQEPQLATRDRFDVPDRAVVLRKFEAIKAFQALVKSQMIEGLDYGVIPGTGKPTLLKPGAEKMAKIQGLADTYQVMESVKDWDKPFFEFQVKCTLSDGVGVVSEGLGECNSMEARYRWREAKRQCPSCGIEAIIKGKQEYGGGWLCFKKQGGCGAKFRDGDQSIESQKTGRVPNEDIFAQVNTLLKMARKRALVDAALSAGRLSDIFTQDMEDIAAGADVESTARVVDTSTGEIQEPPAKPAAPAKPAPTAGPKQPQADSPVVVMNRRAAALAGKYGLQANELIAWCDNHDNKAFPLASMTWTNAGIMEKNAALDVFEKSYAPEEPK